MLALGLLGATTPGNAYAVADLAVTGAITPDPANPGDTLTVTATVRNNGDVAAEGAAVSFNFFTNAVLTGGTGCNAFDTIFMICQIGTIAPGAIKTRSITLRIPEGSEETSASTAMNASHDGIATDPTPDDNNTVAATAIEPRGDLKLVLDAAPPAVTVGGAVNVTATVTNTAAGPARGSTLRLQVPPELTMTTSAPGCGGSTLNVSCDLSIVAAGATVTRTFALSAPREGTFFVLGTVTHSRPDPTPADTQYQTTIDSLAPPEPPPPPPTPTIGPTQTPRIGAGTRRAPAKSKPRLPRPVRITISRLAKGVPRKRCVRSRKLRLRLRKPGGAARTLVQIYVGKRRIRTVKGKALSRSVRLRKLPRGKYKLLVVMTLRDGGRFSGRRTLRACRSKSRR